jgi:hypothetical protein
MIVVGHSVMQAMVPKIRVVSVCPLSASMLASGYPWFAWIIFFEIGDSGRVDIEGT